MSGNRARQDLLVVGIGNTLREDDGVGFDLVHRLRKHFGSDLDCLEVYEMDIVLAETIAKHDELLVIDALVVDEDVPFKLVPLLASESFIPGGGFISHVFDWGAILALARDCFGNRGKANLLGISATSFGLSERLSPACAAKADEAFQFLLDYCSESKT